MNSPHSTDKTTSRWRPYILTIIGIILVFGFFFLVMSLQSNGNGTGTGSDSGTASGFGSGNADSGNGRNSKGESKKDGHDSSGKQSGKGSSSVKTQSKETSSKKVTAASVTNVKGTEQTNSSTLKAIPLKKRLVPLNVSAISKSKADGDDDTGDGEGGGRKGKGGFYGIKVRGNTIFVVDVSGSMSDLTRERLPRIEILKRQLKDVVRSTGRKLPDSKYCIIAFSAVGCCSAGNASGYTVFPAKRLKRFSDGYDADIKTFVSSLHASGGTDLLSAMQATVKIISNGENKIKAIFLLTDGEPQSGWFDIQDLIYKKIKKTIVINCISIGRRCPEMEKIANDYEGRYKEIL